jgi:asparagine synthase (glutamine-hydrolysing)
MQVGFAVLIRDDQVELQFFGRRPGEPRSLVTHARQGEVHAVLMGRLTYRRELLSRLSWDSPASTSNDAELALAAYRHWGAAALGQLEGNFAVVLWDGAKNLLLGSRDPFGGYPLFWTAQRGTLAVGTCMQPLLQYLPGRSLNLDYVAEYLAVPGSWAHEVVTQQCAYHGIHRVLPGHILKANSRGGAVQQYPYWNWSERMVNPGTDRLEELRDMVANTLRQAVRQHLRGRVASHVSGGMDSTAVALLARDGLRDEPGQPPVHALSLVFERLGELPRETPYVECALAQPGLVPHQVAGDDVLDFDCFADPPFHNEPQPGLNVLSVMGHLAEVAANLGAETLFTGDGADLLLDVLPFHIADLLRHGALRAAWNDAWAWGYATNSSAWSYLREYGLLNLLPARWRAGLAPLWRGGHASWEQQRPGTIAPWIRKSFSRAHALGERSTAHLLRLASSVRSMNVANTLASLHATSGDWCSWSVAAPHGLAIIHPFRDPRFVSLCLGIHARFRQEPGTVKPLLAEAMRDVLPDMIRKRRVKGYFNAPVHGGLVRNLPVVEALVRDTAVDDLGLFDREVLLRCLHQAAMGQVSVESLSRLHITLSWLRWYTLQDEWQRQTLTPVETLQGASDVYDLAKVRA